MTTETQCPTCTRTNYTDATICPACRNYLETCLLETSSLLDDLDVTLTKQAQTRGHGMSDEIDPVKFMYNIGASNAADRHKHVLMSWAALVRDEDGQWLPVVDQTGKPIRRPGDHHHIKMWRPTERYTGKPTAQDAAAYLLRHLQFLTHHDAAADAYDEITTACQQIERVMDIQPGRMLVGECTTGLQHGTPCSTILWAAPHTTKTTCPTCDTVWDVKTRRLHTYRQATHTAATATTITRALNLGGIAIDAHRIHVWASRGLLTPAAPRRYIVGHVARLIMLAEAGEKLSPIEAMEPSK